MYNVKYQAFNVKKRELIFTKYGKLETDRIIITDCP